VKRLMLGGALCAALTACGQPTAVIPASAGTVHLDRTLTPADVATDDVRLICTPGHAAAVRMPLSEWHRVAPQVFATYGVDFGQHRNYELDHLVPLELGGSNAPSNLWPEPLAEAKRKDQIENQLHQRVCAGTPSTEAGHGPVRLDIHTAQQAMRLWADGEPLP
jgi:hypothetical protein